MPDSIPRRRDLLETLEAGRIPAAGFHHRQHIQAAWLYLTRYPLVEAIPRCAHTIRSLAERLGYTEKYNETITMAYMLFTYERMQRPDAPDTWEEFAAAFPELFDWNPGLLDQYYQPETWRSPEARVRFLAPDLSPSEA